MIGVPPGAITPMSGGPQTQPWFSQPIISIVPAFDPRAGKIGDFVLFDPMTSQVIHHPKI